MPSKYRSSFQRGHVYKNPVWVPSSRLSKEGINDGYLAWQRTHMQLRKTVDEDNYIASSLLVRLLGLYCTGVSMVNYWC